jgi:hypothetical protein
MSSRYRWTRSYNAPEEVSGRQYREMRDVHCFECEKNLRELTPQNKFLKWCEYVECRVFLCPDCRSNHEMMHQLANDEHEEDKLNAQVRRVENTLRKVQYR